MQKKKTLILLTDYFPFGEYEIFLLHELEYLKNEFEKIFILACYAQNNQSVYPLPENVFAIPFKQNISLTNKILSLRFLTKKYFKRECRFVSLLYDQKLSFKKIKSMLAFLQSAATLEKALKKFIVEKKIAESELIIYSNWTDWRAMAATQISKNVIAVSRAHNADVYFERHPESYLPFRKLLIDKLEAIFFISENGKAYTVSKMLGAQKKDLHVLRLGTPFKGRNPEPDEKVLAIVSCSRMDRVKRIDLIGDILCKSNLPIRWIHFGDGNLRNELEAQRNEWIKKSPALTIEFMGNVSNEQVIQFYLTQHIDLFINTSEYEGIPVAIMEAMSTGIPVMATDVGGVNELVNNENGKLISSPPDVEEAAKWFQIFYALLPEEKKHRREKAFEMWNSNYNAANNFTAFSKELLALKK